MLRGIFQQLAALGGDKLFIRGDDALARLEAGGDKLVCRMKAAHCLDDDLNLGVVEDDVEIFYKELLVGVPGEVLEVEDVFYLELGLSALSYYTVVIFVDDLGNAASDNAVAHYSYIHGNFLPTVIFLLFYHKGGRR